MVRARCGHDITRDILKALIEHDEGEGVAPSRLLFGKQKGSLNYQTLNPWLERLSDTGLITVLPGSSIRSRLCSILPKGELWLLRFNRLEEMVEGR